jgi:RNA ligase partner protein
MEKYIIDTNYFVNLEIKTGLGKNPIEIIENFCELAQKLNREKKTEFYITPSVIKELETFITNVGLIEKLKTACVVKTPDFHKIDFPAAVFYQLVDEIRDRSYRGLKVSEELISTTADKFMKEEDGKNMSKQDFQKKTGEIIKNLRDRYRQATRVNFLDSVVDLELITLAKELNGTVVSADEGVVRWGRYFGIKEIDPHLFKDKLLNL